MIPRQLSSVFSPEIRSRGDRYFKSRRVRIARANSAALTALVSGTSGYVVELHADPDLLTTSCTCPYAADYGMCKHIWATLRQADAEGMLEPIVRSAGRNAPLELLGDADYIDDEFDDEDASGEGADAPLALDEAWMTRRPPAPPPEPLPPRAPAPKRIPPARPPEWMSLLDDAHRQLAHLPPLAAMPSAEWPANRRIVYIVDLPLSANTAGMVVEVATEKATADGTWDALAPLRLPADTWQSAPDPLDRRIAQMLIGAPPPNPYGGLPRTSGFVLRGAAFETT
ncbi:MAG: SWIM zinc finger family protein, partial [Gemmatimonadaceae bacterium]